MMEIKIERPVAAATAANYRQSAQAGPSDLNSRFYVDVPAVDPQWRRKAVRRTQRCEDAEGVCEGNGLVLAVTARPKWKQGRLNFAAAAAAAKGATATGAAAAHAGPTTTTTTTTLSHTHADPESPDSTDSVHQPLKRIRLTSSSEPSSASPHPTPAPGPTGRRRRRLSPLPDLNPFRPYYAIPFPPESYPADAQASLQVEQPPQQRCTSVFGIQTWSPAARVAASPEGYRCQWMLRPRTFWDPDGECCGRAFISVDLMTKHVLKHHVGGGGGGGGALDPPQNGYACKWSTCLNRSYHSLRDIQAHLAKHLAPEAWSCPFQICRLSSSRPKNESTHDQHVEKAHDSLHERLRPLARPLPVKPALASASLPPLPTDHLQSWQTSIPVPRVTKHKGVARLPPWQSQIPVAASGGLVGVAHREEANGGAAPWSSILPILEYLEPCGEPVDVTWPRDAGVEWEVDFSADDPALAVERFPEEDEEPSREPSFDKGVEVVMGVGVDEEPPREPSFEVVMDAGLGVDVGVDVDTGVGVDVGADTEASMVAVPAEATLLDCHAPSTDDTAWTPPRPFPPRRRAATASLSLSPQSALRRDASTQTDTPRFIELESQSTADAPSDPRRRLGSLPAIVHHLAALHDTTPPPAYSEVLQQQQQQQQQQKTTSTSRFDRAVQMSAVDH